MLIKPITGKTIGWCLSLLFIVTGVSVINAQDSFEQRASFTLRYSNGKAVCSHGSTLKPAHIQSLENAERFKQRTERRPERTKNALFEVDYFGYNAEQVASFQAATDEWAKTISSSVPINILAVIEELPPGVIASAGPTYAARDFPGAPRPDTWYVAALCDKLAGFDLGTNPFEGDGIGNFQTYDYVITFSTRFLDFFYFGTDGNTPPNQLDYYSVVLHEIGHGLGFLALDFYSGGVGFLDLAGSIDVFSQHMVTKNPTPDYLTDLPDPSFALGDALTSNNLFFSGIVSEGQRGGPPRLYAPSTYRPGSSISHLDEFTYNGSGLNGLMTPSIGLGQSAISVGPMVKSIFTDLGWGGPSPRRSGLNDRTSHTYNGYHNHDHGNGHAGYNPRSGGGNPTGGRFGLQADLTPHHTAAYQLFPNPVVNQVSLTLPAGLSGELEVRLSDVAGKEYNLGTVDGSAERTVNFDLTKFRLSAGVYFMNIYNEEAKELKSLRLVKTN